MRQFKKLRSKLGYLDHAEIEQIYQAYLVARQAHEGQKRRTGEDYITHPLAVGGILADMRLDATTVSAAILHDVIEDTSIDKQTILTQFGAEIAEMVDGVSKLTQIEFASRAQAQAESFRKMVMAMAKDIRVILVKLADRLHNMRTLFSLPIKKQYRIARETLEIFAPIAKRLGMYQLSSELEELGFAARYPRRYDIIKKAVQKARGNRKKMLSLIEKKLHEGLTKGAITVFNLVGREKHFYSIYRKMSVKKIPFNEIMDVYAFRVIVDSHDMCYRALGVVHSTFKPLPERFKDYIAIPKANGYQSLHTTLFGPYGLPIEVQIRTAEMHRLAESGIAAHWLYKFNEEELHESQLRAQKWVKHLLELQRGTKNTAEFVENVKVDLFPDEIYVFTPKGRIVKLPSGATVVDFAYAVHTEIGNHCEAAKIDRQLVPLSSPLANGQTIAVLTNANTWPNPAWLDFVVTGKARSSIKDFLKSQHRYESIALGKQLIKQALALYKSSLRKLSPRIVEQVMQAMKYSTLDNMLAEIGLGNRNADLVARQLMAVADKLGDIQHTESVEPLAIQGTEGMVIHYGECCYPIPGDPIIGVMDSGSGIMVHRRTCRQIAKLQTNPSNCIPIRWAEDVQGEFLVKIVGHVHNRRGVLTQLAIGITDVDASIEDVSIKNEKDQTCIVTFIIKVTNRVHVEKIMRYLSKIKSVMSIVRGE